MKLTYDQASAITPEHKQDTFSHARAAIAYECVDRLFKAIPKSRRIEYLGEANDVYLFIEAADRHAPDKPSVKPR